MLQRSAARRLQILLGLLLALGGARSNLGNLGARCTELGPLIGREMLWWAPLVLVLAFVASVERLPLSSIGFKRLSWGTVWAVPEGAALVVGIPVIYFVVFPLLHLHMNTAEMKPCHNRWRPPVSTEAKNIHIAEPLLAELGGCSSLRTKNSR